MINAEHKVDIATASVDSNLTNGENDTLIVGIQDEILRIRSLGLLDDLLKDKTTKSNILRRVDFKTRMMAWDFG